MTNNWCLIEKELLLVEEKLQFSFQDAGAQARQVTEYIAGNQGKRIRPALFLLAAQRQGFDLNPLTEVAAAFELLHTATLLHDDVIDQAATRRGKKAAHLHWSNKIAILSGDFILSQVFKIFAAARSWPLLDIVVDMTQKLTEGEVEQAFCDINTPALEERYFKWIGNKSASFFAGCCKAGSLLGGDEPEQQALWASFGYNLGIAFQLVDDLLDYTGSDTLTGKPLYGDLKNKVMTLPLIKAAENSNLKQSQFLKSFLQQERLSEEDLTRAAELVCQSSGPGYTYSKAGDYADLAVEDARKLKQLTNEKRGILEVLAEELKSRRR